MQPMLRQVSPTLHVTDMRRTLSFFEGSLGFRCTFKLQDDLHPEIPYAIVARDQVEIHLQLRETAAGTSVCYITVDDADSVWAEVQKAGVRVLRPIEDSAYGMRDFNVADPDGNSLGFGQPIPSA
jgi:predicted enzyme related to lactoylglutathione lyase